MPTLTDGQQAQVAPEGSFATFLESRKDLSTKPPALVTDDPAPEPAPTPDDEPETPPVAAADTAPFTDPETGTVLAHPTRNDRRLAKAWERSQALEARIRELEQRPAPVGEPAAPVVEPEKALADAAQARIRPKPDRTAIGTTYATYEDYVEDCAIWGGELAAEKRQLLTEQKDSQTRLTAQQTAFEDAKALARPVYADFDEVTTRNLPINQAIHDATVNAPKELIGHVLYYLGSHEADCRRIAKLPPGPALVAMGEVLATVRQSLQTSAAAADATDDDVPARPAPPKPHSRAPMPLEPVSRASTQPARLDTITDPLQFMAVRNEQERQRRMR